MSIPKEPRQQMINIMYLVLIALLALNVSNEIVNAFQTLDKGIQASNTAIDAKVNSSFKSFEKAVETNDSGKPFLEQAKKANEYSKEFVAYIDGLRTELNDAAGGPDEGGEWVKKLDDTAIPTRFMVVGDGSNNGRGYELEAKINEYKAKLDALFTIEGVTPEDKQRFDEANLLTTEMPADTDKPDWAHAYFDQMPHVSAITLMDKYKNDMKNSVSAAVDIFSSKVNEEIVLFDQFDAVIVPSASKLIQGETFEAEVFLSSSASASNVNISINGSPKSVDKGKATYTAKASSLGKKTITAKISSKDGQGKTITRDATFTYDVVPPPDHVAIASPNKMNVFYIGVDNPVSCAITGIRDDKVKASMSGGTISKASGAGQYSVRVSSPGKATINLSGPKATGGTFNGAAEFRVKRIPDPVVMLGKKKPGAIRSGEFKAQQGLRAELENFDFDTKFKVISYEVCLAGQGDLLIAPNQGAKFGGNAGKYIQQAKPGNIIYFDKIKVKAPDGSTRDLGSASYRIL